MTLDGIDTATGRFLTYLEAAVGEHAPDAKGVATSALAARLPHADAAGLLAEAVGDTELVVVMDGLENLCDEAGAHSLATLGTFIRYASSSVRFVLVSRVGVPLDVAGFTGLEGFATVGESDLAFTAAEAREALLASGSRDIDADDVIAATGGWVAGVLFEAWRSEAHVAGTGGEVDPLHGYLASQILDKLTDDERTLLVVGSLLGGDHGIPSPGARHRGRRQSAGIPSGQAPSGHLEHRPDLRHALSPAFPRVPVHPAPAQER